MIHLKSISVHSWDASTKNNFPFNLAVVQSLRTLDFTSPVTFFVGENGSGKSTLLEAIACAAKSITVGRETAHADSSLTAITELSKYIRLSWQKRTHKGFFLRAEDFFGYARRLTEMRTELERNLKDVEKEYQDRSKMAMDYARMPYLSQIRGLQERYGDGLDNYSHGESFLTLFQARFIPGGLYLLDEPEAPLSPLRQFALISLLKSMIQQDAQFIIATHSPILMAFPEAAILNFDKLPIRPIKYGELEHVKLVKEFLNNPDAFLRQL